MNKKVSICVPIYGVAKYIGRCAQSLFNQTYNNIEFVFVDDCTKDNSIDVLKQVASQFSDKNLDIKLLRHEMNRGLAAARNTGVANATGDFILNVDSDDWLDIKAVETLIEVQRQSNADIVSFNAIAYYPNYREAITHPHYSSPKEMCIKLLEGGAPQFIWCRMIRRNLYTDNKIHACEGVNMGEDAQVIPLLAYYAKSVAVCDLLLYHYECRNTNSYTKSFSEDKYIQRKRTMEIRNNFFKDKGEEYMTALQGAESQFVLSLIIETSKLKDLTWCKHFISEKKKLSFVNLKGVRISKKLIWYFDSPILVKYWVCIFGGIKHYMQHCLSIFNFRGA